MIRAVLVGWSNDDWRLYRQPQWMAEVRRSPEVTQFPRRHFDIDEDAFRVVLDSWGREGVGTSLSASEEFLARYGASEVVGP